LTLEHDAQGRVEVGSQEPSPESQRLTREIDFGTSSEPVPEVSRELTAPGGPGVESTPGKSDAEWVREEDDSLLTPGQAASVPSSETDEQESRDIDGPGMETLPSREVHPDRYIEAIVPMLSEINDEFHVDVHPSDSPERRAVDIERELVETMTQEDADVEDQIGATVLEICLDAQWGLHQDHRDASGVSSEEPESTPFTGESEEFDTVQPEESAVLEEGFMDEVSQISRMESNASSQSEIRCSEVQRPFERLFSELRRRASHG